MASDNALTPGIQVKDYLIGELLCRGQHTLTWRATQVSVQREVVICSLRETLENRSGYEAGFIDDVRAKASIEHPLIGSVFEAVHGDGHCFFAREKLAGESLAHHHEAGLSLEPLVVARIIRSLAEAYKYLESKSTATLPVSPDDLFLDEMFHCRLVNMVVSGEPDPEIFTRDKQLLGALFQDLLNPGQPGSTRIGSLLDFMSDLGRQEPLSWEQIHELADEVERQLAEPKQQAHIKSPTMPMKPFISGATLAKLGILVVTLSIVIGLGVQLANRKEKPKERDMTDLVKIPAGTHPGPDGTVIKSPGFWIDAHEVTIGEYAKFLQSLNILEPEEDAAYQHAEQPVEKISHQPDDWENLYAAAKTGGQWQGLKVDLNYPVVGVDWWDAYAYATWKNRQLPTREQWYVSGSAGSDMSQLQSSLWLPVDQAEQTALGVFGLAGNVSEWTLEQRPNPADLSQPPAYVICGASYLNPKYGARAREWVDDRSLRRKDLGFRTLSAQSEED